VGAAIRRRYRVEHALPSDRVTAVRVTSALCWLVPIAIGSWMLLFNALGDGVSDGVIWLVEIAGAIGFFGLFAATLWNAVLTLKGQCAWAAKLWSVLLWVSAAVVLYVAIIFHLIHFGVKY
jgi:hypothetical protein